MTFGTHVKLQIILHALEIKIILKLGIEPMTSNMASTCYIST